MTAAGLDLAATRQFIELVYPATIAGKLHLSSTGDYVGRQFDRADVDGLTGYVRQLDQAGRQSIYLRAMTDRPGRGAGKRGGAADSVELVGLWSDLDFGQVGHNHDPSQHGGLVLPPDGQAAAKIVETSQLPKPTVWIHSGGGLYGWWLLYVPFTLTDDSRADVGGLSKRWQAALAAGAASLGFHYGTGVSDLARVLRLPGTVNRKVPGDPRPCHILSDNGPRYSLEVLTSACDAAERALANAQQNRQAVTDPVRATAEQFMQGDASKPWAPVAPGTGSPFDDFETRTDWADILCPHGWEEESRHSGGATRYWRRPGKGEGDGHSATTGHAADRDRMFNFSDHAGLPTLESMTKQRVYALLNHHGDMKAAAAELYARGHGARRVETVSLADDTDFWTERKVLTHIRDFALSRLVSPWAVLGCVLVRVIVATSPLVVLPAIVGGVGSLNLFLALMGVSGEGKGGATTVAAEAVDLGLTVDFKPHFKTHSVGSGQGIAHAYGHYDAKLGKVVRHGVSALLELEEIDHLSGHTKQNGSTTLPELRRLYMGEKLSHLYVDPTKRIEIEAHTYRAGLVIGAQPSRVAVLLDDADGGSPQRFLWLPTGYTVPEVIPAQPDAPWPWVPPQWEPDHPDSGVSLWSATRGRVTLPVPDCAVSAVREARIARLGRRGDPLDSHRLFTQEKVAAGFAILDGRAAISEDDWRLSGRLMVVSDTTRAGAVAVLGERNAQRNKSRGKADAERAVIVDNTRAAAAVKRVIKSVLRILGDGQWMTYSELRRGLSGSAARDYLDDALVILESSGQVISETTVKGRRYRRCGEVS
jgi:hypothetical protein